MDLFVTGDYSNLNMAMAGNVSTVMIDINDAYGNQLNASNWRYPHPGRGVVRCVLYIKKRRFFNGS